MTAPEQITHDVVVKWTGKTARSEFTDVVLSIKGENILALTDPEDPEKYTLVPLNSGLVLHVDVTRNQGIEE